MFPILSFCLVFLFAAGWLIFGVSYWKKAPARVGGILFATMSAVIGFSLNTPDCTTWGHGCHPHSKDKVVLPPPETMTNPQTKLVPMPYPVMLGCDEKKR